MVGARYNHKPNTNKCKLSLRFVIKKKELLVVFGNHSLLARRLFAACINYSNSFDLWE